MRLEPGKLLLTLGVLLAPLTVSCQQSERDRRWLVRGEAGEWREPTIADALLALRGESDLVSPGAEAMPAISILRQVHTPRSPIQLEAFANRLGDILLLDAEYLSPEYDTQVKAYSALVSAMGYGRGRSYPAAFDVLVRVYETRADRVLAGGGTDPIHEAHRRGSRSEIRGLVSALGDIYHADPEGRGRDYMRRLAESSTPPPPCREVGGEVSPSGSEVDLSMPPCPNHSLWCHAVGKFMYENPGTLEPPRKPPESVLPNGPDGKTFDRLCNERVW
ncbi:hypothetical protein [Candidatus Palauibacter polyketidifaciens]|uniref:hypothetical protein n=1 Tax=Candidatus Palauibacter polyketidifaciens TaxID=3056740 RepID=UPI00239C7100|nr:hypothetical protein [Candidatus Palauibacter polyketidifaciens]MDE2720882.1 hypothetical protein [Candidatus Palauibacter polyketidifaciens]